MTRDEKCLLGFLRKYPNGWHSYETDAKTRKAVDGLVYKYNLAEKNQFHQVRLWKLKKEEN